MTWALHTSVSLDDVNLHLVALEEAGLLGIAEQDGVVTVYLRQRASLPLAGTWEPVEERDWNEVWKQGLEPVVVGALVVRPPWSPSGAGLEIVIEPGQAFGTGHHETTAGCLAALQELDLTGMRVLDVGTGSGVLGIAAALLGAREVVATDIDPLAVAAATENVERNGVAAIVAVAAGSASDVHGRFDVVVANLDTATLHELAGDLARRLAPAGTLVVSGVSAERRDEAEADLRAVGLAVWSRPGHEWVLMTARSVPGAG